MYSREAHHKSSQQTSDITFFRHNAVMGAAIAPTAGINLPPKAPIRVAPKPKGKQKNFKKHMAYKSLLFDDRGFPDPHNDWESLLPEVKAGRLIRKRVLPSGTSTQTLSKNLMKISMEISCVLNLTLLTLHHCSNLFFQLS